MLPAAFSRVQGCGWTGLRVSETASSCSGPAQVALGTTCLFLPFPSLILPYPIFSSFPSCTSQLLSPCPHAAGPAVQCSMALPTSPRRRDHYLDSHIRCRGSRVGRPGWAELNACLSSPPTRHPTAFICHKSQDTVTVTESCPLTRVAYTPKHNPCLALPDVAVLHHLLVSSPGGVAKSHAYTAHFPIRDIFLKAPVPGDK